MSRDSLESINISKTLRIIIWHTSAFLDIPKRK